MMRGISKGIQGGGGRDAPPLAAEAKAPPPSPNPLDPLFDEDRGEQADPRRGGGGDLAGWRGRSSATSEEKRAGVGSPRLQRRLNYKGDIMELPWLGRKTLSVGHNLF
jgi:hypothetical protein